MKTSVATPIQREPELFSVSNLQGVTRYEANVSLGDNEESHTDFQRAGCDTSYKRLNGETDLPARKCAGPHGHAGGVESKPESFSGDPLNDRENPRYRSAIETGVVAQETAQGSGGGAETVRANTFSVQGSAVHDIHEERGRAYPKSPGWKREGTSKQAAEKITSEAETLRELVLKVLAIGDYTADEISERLKRSVLSVRPRVSELLALNKIEDSGQRRKNESKHSAVVWRKK